MILQGYKCCASRSTGQKSAQCDGVMQLGEVFLICTKCGRLAEPEVARSPQVAAKPAETPVDDEIGGWDTWV